MRFLATLILAAFLYQAEPAPAHQAAAQNDNRAANEGSQAAPAVEQNLGGDKAPAARGDAEPASDKIKKAEWVQIFISALVALAVFWTAWTYNEQRKLMARQLEAMNRQAGMMQGQLVAMDAQGRAMTESLYQSQRAVTAAEQNVEIARDARSDAREEAFYQRETMQRQLDLMSKQAEASQTAANASEESAKIAREAFYVGERAYFGITEAVMTYFVVGEKPRVRLTFFNGGRTPAWKQGALSVRLNLNFDPVILRTVITIREEEVDIGNRFIPAQTEKVLYFTRTDYVVTQEDFDAVVTNKTLRAWLHFFLEYTDISGDVRKEFFAGVYHPDSNKFFSIIA